MLTHASSLHSRDGSSTFYRDGFARDSTQAELQSIVRSGSNKMKGSKSDQDPSFMRPSKMARTVIQPSTNRSGPKRKAFVDACDALTEHNKHDDCADNEQLNSSFGKGNGNEQTDAGCELNFVVSGTAGELLISPIKLSQPRQHSSNDRDDGAWTQRVLYSQSASSNVSRATAPNAKLPTKPVFSPIKLHMDNDEPSSAAVAFRGFPSEPFHMCTPSKQQRQDEIIPFSWHSHATIGLITDLPHINLLAADLGVNDSMFDFSSPLSAMPGMHHPSSTSEKFLGD